MLNEDGLQVRLHLLLDEQHPLGLVFTVQGVVGVDNRRQGLAFVLLVGEVDDFRSLSVHQVVHHLDALNCLVAFKGKNEFFQCGLLKFRGHFLAIRKSKFSIAYLCIRLVVLGLSLGSSRVSHSITSLAFAPFLDSSVADAPPRLSSKYFA